MHTRDYRDLIGGGLLIALGLWVGLHAVTTFDVGNVNRMGPGMFPAGLGFLLATLGAAIALPAFFRGGELPTVDWRPMLLISAGVLAFALIVPSFGMVPAIVLLTIAGVYADDKIGIRGALLLSVALSLIAYLIFRVGLGIVLEPFRWPF
jgi:hypothetical protein